MTAVIVEACPVSLKLRAMRDGFGSGDALNAPMLAKGDGKY